MIRRLLVPIVPIGCALIFWPNEETPQTQLKSEQTSIPEEIYTIEQRTPIEKEGEIRYEYDIVVRGKPDSDKLQSISHDIIEDVTEVDSFQAALLRFYDDEAYIGTEPPLGEAIFAPEGDYALADWVAPGEYDKMSFGWQLREKEWSTQLSEREIQIWRSWQTLYEKQNQDDPDIKAKVTRSISSDYDLHQEDVQQIVLKQSVWATL